jgi:hypothetical protein
VVASGEQHVAEIQDNLACPACEYNLRGLRGDIVQCPECGATCDAAQLIANRWTLPWHRAPKLSIIYVPVALVAFSPFAMIMVLVIVARGYGQSPAAPVLPLMIGVDAALFVGWCFAMYRAYNVFAGFRGIGLSLISHLLFAAYVVGFGTILSAAITCVRGIFALNGLMVTISLFAVAISLPLVWLGRRGEKYVARHCIRRHLQLQAAMES